MEAEQAMLLPASCLWVLRLPQWPWHPRLHPYCELDLIAVASCCLLVGTGDGEWVRFEGSKTRKPKVHMLTSFPGEMNVLDRDNHYLATRCLKFDLVANSPSRTAWLGLSDSDILEQKQNSPYCSVHEEGPDCKPDIVLRVTWHVNI